MNSKKMTIEFMKKIIFMSIFFFIGLSVSNNNVSQGFMDFFWILIIGAFSISAFNVYINPYLQRE